ncbi:hypothetical protein L593_10020 [Salinarchaeum sp. Harcht-Bsk1]|uniref:DUF5812 family protein n=1 Tax=Salinarchaeum sp. Harcht-Bsk1 TaxID=1333523 RepID=UPI00034230C8|nr:DUF5812 family protein [Salinarchaeum sp. Harcht-Bsk1]AGN01949.1 hypothetical protein L593_10020 [Salinarchaeum sp. Harcht-Bsk1]
MTTTVGTFLVTEADPESAILRNVEDGQLHTLSTNPDLDAGEVVEATLTAEPPMEVTWTAEIDDRRTIECEVVDLEPTTRSAEAAASLAEGELERFERAGEGEVHVLTVGADGVETAVDDVLDDEATIERAARLGAVRVEIRTGDEFLSVRYLPK